MDDNLKIILGEFEKLKGQHVINHWKVERFIAIAADKDDYYYVTYDGKKTTWSSCLMGLVPLKGKIDDKHYDEFIRLAKLNHNDQLLGHEPDEIAKGFNYTVPITYKVMAQKHKREMENISEDSEFLTEVCWDLN